ncbi:MAG TPA: metallophosphoesterase [Candidatus Limnocylindria bacterium]|nr:metallophosphoesterase [Candidatus Limnocylindria bacterium]
MVRRYGLAAVAVLGAAAVFVVFWLLPRMAVSGGGSLTMPSSLPTLPVATAGPSGSAPPEPQVLLAVGDVATCESGADDAVAALASRLPGTIALLGDTVYDDGSTPEFRECFDPSWGQMRSRIRPAVGNHEYHTDAASGFFTYFGDAAGEAGKGWYSYDLGAWHVVVLNSNCGEDVECWSGTEQYAWLQSDLASFHGDCLLAYWHHPRWSSGRHGNSNWVGPFWDAIRDAGGDIVLSGHDHTYERVSVDGVREFVVGTGGKSHYPFTRSPLPGTEARNDSTYGLLWLALGERTYQWQFLGLGDTGFADAGSGEC